MGLDYGSKTVGVAVSDPLGITAQGVETICRKDENKYRDLFPAGMGLWILWNASRTGKIYGS